MSRAVRTMPAGGGAGARSDQPGLPWEALADAARRHEVATALHVAGRMSREELQAAHEASDQLARAALEAAGWLPPEHASGPGRTLQPAETTLRLVWSLAESEGASARVRDELASHALGEEATAARRCHQLVGDALVFGAIELAATLGVDEGALPG